MADENDTPDEGGIDLESLVGKVLDDRGFTTTRADRIDILDGLEERITSIFKSSGGSTSTPTASSSFDEKGFFDRFSALLDEKAKASTGGGGTTESEKTGGWLSRWLGLGDK